MRVRSSTSTARSAVFAALVTSCCIASAASVALGSGTVIPVSLGQNLSSDHSSKGDTFTATVRHGYLNLPEGTRIVGIVRSAVQKTKDRPGSLVLEFTQIRLPNGRTTRIDGSPVGLDGSSVSTGKNGRLVAKPGVKDKRLTYIGYGAGAGALLGVLSNSNRVVEDTVIGGVLGYLGGALEKGGQKQKNNVMLKEGASMGVLLHKSANVRL